MKIIEVLVISILLFYLAGCANERIYLVQESGGYSGTGSSNSYVNTYTIQNGKILKSEIKEQNSYPAPRSTKDCVSQFNPQHSDPSKRCWEKCRYYGTKQVGSEFIKFDDTETNSSCVKGEFNWNAKEKYIHEIFDGYMVHRHSLYHYWSNQSVGVYKNKKGCTKDVCYKNGKLVLFDMPGKGYYKWEVKTAGLGLFG